MSYMNESCHIWMNYVTYEWVMLHMNESCHIRMSRVTYEWVMAHMNESCHIWMSHVTYEWAMSHMNKPCHIWTNHVTYEWVMSHMNESCHSHEWAMSHTQATSVSHSVAHTRTHQTGMSGYVYIYTYMHSVATHELRDNPSICEIRVMTHAHVTILSPTHELTKQVCQDMYRRIRVYILSPCTNSGMSHDPSIYDIRVMTHSYVTILSPVRELTKQEYQLMCVYTCRYIFTQKSREREGDTKRKRERVCVWEREDCRPRVSSPNMYVCIYIDGYGYIYIYRYTDICTPYLYVCP